MPAKCSLYIDCDILVLHDIIIFVPIIQNQIVKPIVSCYNGTAFCFTISLMKNSSHIPTGAISASAVNYCNLWSSYPSWYRFNGPVQAIIVLSKSRLKHVSC